MALLVAGLIVVVVHRAHDVDDADRGTLTRHQYALALQLAHFEITRDDAQVTTAVAVVGRARNATCTGQRPPVYLVGRFPHLALGGPGNDDPDTWMVLLADPETGVLCTLGPSTGFFHAPVGSADLTPAL